MLTSAALRARLLKDADVSEAIQQALKGRTQLRGLWDSGADESRSEKLPIFLLLAPDSDACG
jgi:hypothetical protein